jgi:P-type Ca2+ transporter type 2C
LVTSDLPALGLASEPPPDNIMKQKPRDPKEGILSDYLMLKISQIVPFIVLGTILLYQWEIVMKHGTIEKAQTMAFATIVFFELFHIYNAKSWDGTVFSLRTFKNRYINIGIIISAALTFGVIYFPPAQLIFGTVALTTPELFTIFFMTSSVVFFNEIQKTIIATEIKERDKIDLEILRR